MSIYFDFKTINELTEDDYYRQPKEFSLKDLSQYNGSDGNPAYVAMEGIVYDISNTTTRSGLTHLGITAGQDLTSEFNSCRGIVNIITSAPRVGVLIDDDYMSGMNNMNFRATMPTNTQVKQDTSKFTPDEWIRYINPLVTYALRETTQGMNTERSYQKFILLGVLVGLGKTPQEAIAQVQEWQNTGASQLLKSGTSTGSATTSGSFGTGNTGMGTGTSAGMGTGTSAGMGTGTSAGMGTGKSAGMGTGTSTGIGTGTSGFKGMERSTELPPYFTTFKFESGGIDIEESTGKSNNTNKSNRLYFH